MKDAFAKLKNMRYNSASLCKFGVAFLVFLIPFILLFDLFVPGYFRYILGDSPQLYWPDLSYLYNSLADGHLPLWDPYERGGDPFWTDPQSALFYPINYLIILIGTFTRGFPYVLHELRMVLHLSIGGTGMLLLLWKGFRLRISAAVIGSVIFMFQPYFTGHIQHVLIFPSAWFPFAAWMLIRLRQYGYIKDAAWLAIFTGLILTAGSPPSAYYALLGLTCFGVVTLFIGYGESKTSAKRFLVLSFGAAFAGLVMALPSLVPAALHIPHSVVNKRDFGYLSSLSVPLKDAKDLIIFPDGMHQEEWIYWGWLPLLLALTALLIPRSEKKSWAISLWIMALVFVLIVFGKDLPFFKILVNTVPGAGLFRHPGRYISVVGFAIPVLSAFGFSTLIYLIPEFIRTNRKVATSIVTAITALVIIWLIIFLGQPMRNFAISDIGHEITWRDERADKLEGLEKDWRILDEGVIGNGMGDRLSLRDFRGYSTNFVYKRWTEIRKAMKNNTALLALFGIRYYGAHKTNYHATVPQIAKVKEYRSLPNRIYKNDNVMPAAFWIKKGCKAQNESDALNNIKNEKDFTRRVILENANNQYKLPDCKVSDNNKTGSAPNYSLSTQNYKPARIINLKPNHVDIQVKAPHDGWLIVNESWYPGWVAYVDGKRQKTFAANYFQRATYCPKGKHLVRFAYEPFYFWPVISVALLTLIFTIIIIIRSFFVSHSDKNKPRLAVEFEKLEYLRSE